MSAKLKNPTFSCRLVTAINQIINVLNAIIVYSRFVQVVSGFNYATLEFKDNSLCYKKMFYSNLFNSLI